LEGGEKAEKKRRGEKGMVEMYGRGRVERGVR